VRVAAAALIEGKLVVVLHRTGDQSYFLLPGGGVEVGESLGQALVREVREETGLTIEPGIPLLINDTIDPSGARHVVNLTFAADVVSGELTDRPEDSRVERVTLVDLGDIESLDLRPPLGPALVAALAAGTGAQARYLGPLWVDFSITGALP
jgi:8-oxo-dGTP pyrophosphatase MutT (NUDIX family)